jgi:hypothetical protein
VTARVLDITTAEYLADPCPTPSLSNSIACELIQRSPLHAWQRHPKLGGKDAKRETTAELNLGTLIHALVLGKGSEQLAVLDVKDFRTNVAKDLRDQALADGKTVIKLSEYLEAKVIAQKLVDNLAGYGIVLDGESETKMLWDEPTAEGELVLCRGMLDHWKMDAASMGATIYDVKTIRSADLKTIQRHILEYGYDIQEAVYRSAMGHLSPESLGRIDFVFLFMETEPPYAVTPVQLDGEYRRLGEVKWERAVRVWARCLATNTWPSYVDQITPVSAPPWALQDAL